MRLFRLRDTDVIFEYDERTRTITLRNAAMACVDDEDHPGSWMVQQVANEYLKLTIYAAGAGGD